MTKLLLALIVSLPAYPALAALSAPEQALVTECAANIDPAKKLLSPETADKCVKGLNSGAPSLLQKYSQDNPAGAADMIGYNNALLDLKEIVVRQESADGALALTRVLEKSDCALCDLQLGPRPELAFEWVGKYASARDGVFKKTVRTWDALGEIRTASLSAAPYSKNKGGWNSQNILDRYRELAKWAKAETVRLEAASKVPGAAAKLNIGALAGILREDLEIVGDSASLGKLQAITTAAGVKEEAPKPSTADKKGKDLAAASGKLSAINPDGRGEYLNQTFDGTGAFGAGAMAAVKPAATGSGTKTGTATGTAVKPVAPVKMTADEEKALGESMMRMEKGKPAGYLADVMGETEAGKRSLAFYQDPKYAKAGTNKLNFAFNRQDGSFGYWDASSKELRIGSEVAEEFAAKRGMTVPQMMKDKAAMKDFALYVSPVMVHESEHQNQTARAIASGIDMTKFPSGNSTDPYTRAKENLSNTQSSQHMIEYCSKHGGPTCWKSFNPMHADNAEKYMAGGVEALDALKAPLYPRIDSFEGGAAREFKSAQTYAAQLQALETKARTNPKGMTRAEQQNLRDYRALMDTRFKWYTQIYQENAANDAEALAFRKKYGTAASGLAVPSL
ncbi:MAG: hypothetical protein PHV33_05590 [Elusimicrobiales bacterium]|nr:hypothetical protein [Elusimicrobiales bacterium]